MCMATPVGHTHTQAADYHLRNQTPVNLFQFVLVCFNLKIFFDLLLSHKRSMKADAAPIKLI